MSETQELIPSNSRCTSHTGYQLQKTMFSYSYNRLRIFDNKNKFAHQMSNLLTCLYLELKDEGN